MKRLKAYWKRWNRESGSSCETAEKNQMRSLAGMKEIGKISTALLILLSSTTIGALAQDFTLSARLSENRVFIGEQFTLTVELEGNSLHSAELPVLPDLNGVRLLTSYPSRGQRISIVNGRTTRTTSWSYTLMGSSDGNWTIPPIDVEIDGEVRSTRPLQVEVLDRRSSSGEPAGDRPDIFAEIEISDPEPVVGQQMVASLVIYFRDGVEVTSYQPASGWRTDGFWREELQNIEQPRTESVFLGNVRYRKATLLRYALFPSRAGELSLTPFSLNLGIRSQPRSNDPFGSMFGGFGTNTRRVTVETEPKAITAKSLDEPGEGLPIGAVGQFDITREINTGTVSAGEPVELVTRIRGEGNLPLVRRPEYDFPTGVELYPPQEETDLNRRGTAISGTRTFRQTFVALDPGRITLQEEQVPVFHPVSETFTWHTLPAIELEVRGDPRGVLSSSGAASNLQPMTGLALWQKPDSGSPIRTFFLWTGSLLPLFLLLIGYRQKRLQERLLSDTGFSRSYHAFQRARQRLDLAETEMADGSAGPKRIYSLIHQALTGFLTDRMGLPEAGLSNSEILHHFKELPQAAPIQASLKKLLERCETIQYAPVATLADMKEDLASAEETLKKLGAILK
ncbi:MAG: BatD family protein [Balneolaceae bacterium]